MSAAVRHFSNKENASSPLASMLSSPAITSTTFSTPRKPRIGGMGRPQAGRFRGANVQAKKRGVSASRQKFTVVAVSREQRTRRAKKLALAKLKQLQIDDIQEEERMDTEVEETSKATPKTLASTTTPVGRHFDPSSTARSQAGHTGASPSMANASARLDPQAGPSRYAPTPQVALKYEPVQFNLQRYPTPPVTHTNQNGSAIPIDFVMKYLQPHLPLIDDTVKLFTLGEHVFATPPSRIDTPAYPFGARIDDTHDQVTYWVEESIQYGGLNDETIKRCRVRGPNIAIVLRRDGEVATPGVLIPANSLVFAAQCSRWEILLAEGKAVRSLGRPNPNLPSPAERTAKAHAELEGMVTGQQLPPSVLYTPSVRSVSTPSQPRNTLSIDELAAPAGTQPVPRFWGPTAGHRSVTAPVVSSAPPTEAPSLYRFPKKVDMSMRPTGNPNELFGRRKLDLIPLYLPHIESFNLILFHLHHPSEQIIHYLLQVAKPRQQGEGHKLASSLFSLPEYDLIGRARFLEGFCNNLNALGVSSDFAWSQLGLAHEILRAVLHRRGAWVDQARNVMLVPISPPAGYSPQVQLVNRHVSAPMGRAWYPPSILRRQVSCVRSSGPSVQASA